MRLTLFAFLNAGALWLDNVSAESHLPTVDLGYEVHQALSFNESSRLYTFRNIRYAQPPVGDLRWALPLPPTGRDSQVQNGSTGRICPQGMPRWFAINSVFSQYFTNNVVDQFNYSLVEAGIDSLHANSSGQPEGEQLDITDDCLFLDVVVPQAVLNRANASSLAPVMVWIHGGAYVTGNKIDSSAGDPSGLISASQKNGSDGFIYVSMNYRLGGLGFMSGELFESEGGIPNLGLHDQVLALRWVQDHIHLFGGDKSQVTVSGGSAGAGSIVHHLTSNGGNGEMPFKRAYVESPGIIPATPETQNAGAVDFLAALDVRSFAEARKMDSPQIIRANADVIYGAKTSTFKYSPQAAGDYINTTAFTALRKGLVHEGVDLLVSHTANEGVVFMPTYATTDAAFTQYSTETFPNATESEIGYLVNDLYPLSAYDGQWYKRNTAFVGDYGLNCYTNALTHAYRGLTRNSEWDVFPALHGHDFLHVFFDGSDPTGMVNATYAGILQEYISNFVMAGHPNADGLPTWSVEGDNFTVMAMTSDGPSVQRDSTEGERCAWLRQNELLS